MDYVYTLSGLYKEMANFGEKLKLLVESSRRKKVDVASAVGVTPATFHDWLRHDYPRLEAIESVCKELGISLGEFFDDEGAYDLLRAIRRVYEFKR